MLAILILVMVMFAVKGRVKKAQEEFQRQERKRGYHEMYNTNPAFANSLAEELSPSGVAQKKSVFWKSVLFVVKAILFAMVMMLIIYYLKPHFISIKYGGIRFWLEYHLGIL